MSKTDKTTPWKVAERRGDCGRPQCGYPCKHLSITRGLKMYRDKGNGQARTRLRTQLAKGVEPEPVRHRHSAHWEAV
jgi:hypothetical protein